MSSRSDFRKDPRRSANSKTKTDLRINLLSSRSKKRLLVSFWSRSGPHRCRSRLRQRRQWRWHWRLALPSAGLRVTTGVTLFFYYTPLPHISYFLPRPSTLYNSPRLSKKSPEEGGTHPKKIPEIQVQEAGWNSIYDPFKKKTCPLGSGF